ncbi:DNA sulfur modification protein DndD [Tropicimonas marinistellae]|uniref:DNA sulfur modification protein DndD n=1 Tax=Tropicimonas marinistellae TaxID=1739787 RepID=UPI00082E1898|nr:DNA sulfur modification protein DndD [Tropicimonas marinistellae]
MILDEIVLHNFGVYRGRHRFELTPESADKPIILIGAQNGAGKTTFLEALQLAFFGRLARGQLRGTGAYEEYLRGVINRNAPSGDGAEVKVSFRRRMDGREHVFEIRRAWTANTRRVREIFEVVVDGQLDRVLTAQWNDFIEELLPPRIAPLFFFDGEKIEHFADLDRSSEIIGTGINALLGLDIVERLKVDLEVLEARKLAENGSADLREELSMAEAELRKAEDRARAENDSVASARVSAERSALVLQRARTALEAEGGGLFATREALTGERARLDEALEHARKDLRAWAGDGAPLLLVPGLLKAAARQSEQEADTEATRALLTHLVDRDQLALSRLKDFGAAEDLVHEVESFFLQDRERLEQTASRKTHLHLSSSARAALTTLCGGGRVSLLDARKFLLERLNGLEEERDDLERKLASVPAAESVAPLLQAVSDSERALRQADAELQHRIQASEAADREASAVRSRYKAKLEKLVNLQLQREDAGRLLQHSAGVRQTLSRFATEVIQHHIQRIERHMLAGLQALFRKDDLIASVSIDPKTFAIELRGSDAHVVSPDQLSAGERQLFAVALLWALAQASGQAAPTVIDTPLGRLDSQHRTRLAERYFPCAGEQVILLSTDEEIDRRLYQKLSPHITRSFTITYDGEGKGSQVEPGYAFAGETGLEAA